MKQLLFLSVVLIALGSCVQRQKSNITGRTDEVYFTPSDTRIKVVASQSEYNNSASSANRTTTPNYSGSYSDRLSNFGSSNRFNYNNYQPTLSPTLMYNNYSGFGLGMSYGNPMMGYGGYNSPFSPYYGYNMPYNNPFYANGWGGGWMTNYYPCYTYNPYMFNSSPYGYGAYGGYNNYNSYSGYNNTNYSNNSSGSNANYARRTGTYSPSTQSNTVNRGDNNTNNNTTSNSNSNSGNSWWKTSSGGSGTTNSGGNTGSSGGGGGRSGGGGGNSSSSSTRRR